MKKNLYIPLSLILISLTAIAGIFWYTLKITKLQNTNKQISNIQNSMKIEDNATPEQLHITSDIEEFSEEDLSEIDTSNWQTYRNEEFGFEFKYPENWKYVITPEGVIQFWDSESSYYLEGNETYIMNIVQTSVNDDFLFQDWEDELSQKVLSRGGELVIIKVGGIDALQGIEYWGLTTQFFYEGKIYSFGLHPSDNYNSIYLGILKTWKFLK